MSTNTMVADMHQNIFKTRGDNDDQDQAAVSDTRALQHHRTNTDRRPDSKQVSDLDYRWSQRLTSISSMHGESPPPPPRIFFGRDDLVEKVVGFAENLTPVALIGAGGIGKTSAVLTVLHDDRIKQRFDDNRWFIRCDQFPATRAHFLRRLSKSIGAGIENPEDLAPLRPFLSSKEMLIVLDNPESILDLQGTNGQEIYAVVDELSRFDNICLCITSRISTIPPHCETLDIPTLSMAAANDTFYRIYKHGKRSDLVINILEQLDFHPLSITLLAKVSQHSKWDINRLSREWERRRTGVLDTRHSGSLATAIELSLASATFQELGPDARELLGVIAFFPQGVDEDNLEWLFPTISDVPNVFDKFCILSLTHRSDGFITMLGPLRDYFCPKDPVSSPLLIMVKECYFTRLSVDVNPDTPGFGDARWITSEDVNVEHLLDVFTSIDANSEDVWGACCNFMDHIYWHKPRLVVLGPKMEALPDDHPSKLRCLEELSLLSNSVGNQVERKRLLTHTLKLRRERGNERVRVAGVLSDLSDANRQMDLFEEGIQQATEASEIFEWLGFTVEQAHCLISLARLLCDDDQLDAAEEAASCAIDLLSEQDEQYRLCLCHRVLGEIYYSKGDTEKAVHRFELALGIASPLSWDDTLFWICYCLAKLFFDQDRFDDAHAYIERAKSHAVNDTYCLGRLMHLQANVWYYQDRLEEAKSEGLRAADAFEKLGAAGDLETCRELLQWIDDEMNGPVASDELDRNGEPLETVLPVVFTDSSHLDGIAESE